MFDILQDEYKTDCGDDLGVEANHPNKLEATLIPTHSKDSLLTSIPVLGRNHFDRDELGITISPQYHFYQKHDLPAHYDSKH